MSPRSPSGVVVDGLGVSPGIATGRAVVLDRRRVTFAKRNITKRETKGECGRLTDAITMSVDQLQALKEQASPRSVASKRGLKVQDIVARRTDGASEADISETA